MIPREKDPELLWGSVLGAAALIGSGWLWSGLPTPLCPLHALTGLPCPTCGMTRAANALLRGDLVAALRWNPFVTLVLAGAGIYVVYAALVVMRPLPRLRLEMLSRAESRWGRISLFVFLALNWIYLIRHRV
jgi:hypothetical protein